MNTTQRPLLSGGAALRAVSAGSPPISERGFGSRFRCGTKHGPEVRQTGRDGSESRPTRPGFTLLEVMLASLLGLIVVIAAMGLFSTLSTSDRRSNENYHRQMELSLAHQTVERSLRGLLMDNTPFPRQASNSPSSPSGRREAKPLTEADGAPAVVVPPTVFKRPRLILEPDTRLPPAMKFEDEKGVVTYITPQRLEVTMTRPPVFAPPTAEELLEARYNDRMDHAAMTHPRRVRPHESGSRSGARAGSRRGSNSASSSRSGASASRTAAPSTSRPSNDQLTEMARRAGLSPDAIAAATGANGATAGTDNAVDPAHDAADESEEVALSPGLRGVFEIHWDPDQSYNPRLASSPSASSGIDESQGSWSLWWRPVPEIEVSLRNAGEAIPDYLTESTLLLADGTPAADLARGSVMLASDLQTCRWEMVSRGVTTGTLSATWLDELPAYATLELRTRSGMWMKWMFEVDWTKGGEPGEPIEPAGASPLGNPAPGAQQPPGAINRRGINTGGKGNSHGSGTPPGMDMRSGGG